MGLIKERAIEVILIGIQIGWCASVSAIWKRHLVARGAAGSARSAKQIEPTEELVQDLLIIATVFAGRLYGSRAKGVRARVKAASRK